LGEVVLQGPHFTVGDPLARQPNPTCKSNKDWSPIDHVNLGENFVPRTNYQFACGADKYNAAIPIWDERPATDYFRLAWRCMTQPGSQRSLHAALIPPGPTHIHSVISLAVAEAGTHSGPFAELNDELQTVLLTGLWSSLPFDYLVKVSGAANVNTEMVERFPAPLEHPAWRLLLLRALRLNSLTKEYAPLWERLYNREFEDDSWTGPFVRYAAPLVAGARKWDVRTPLRSDFDRRAALVEIDALAALMLGLSADQLVLIFQAQFPVLRKYEYEMYFDAGGRRIAKEHHAYGINQRKDDFKLLEAHMNGESSGDLLERYEPFAPDDEHISPWFYKPDREAEMRFAHAEFTERLGLK
jgi:hypothetical protein